MMVMTKRMSDLSLRPWLAQLGPSLKARRAMLAPPTNTYNVNNDFSSIASAQYIPLTNGNIDGQLGSTLVSYFMAGAVAAGTGSYPNKLLTGFSSVNHGSFRTANVNRCAFIHIGRYLEFRLRGNLGRKMLVRIDDEYVSLTPQTTPSNGQFDRWHFDFGTDGVRRVDWMCSGGEGLIGIAVGPNDGIAPAPRRGPRMIIIGDSFAAGTGADAGGASGFPAIMGDALGWDDVWPSGVGSTSYWTRGVGPYLTYGERMATDVYPFEPDIVMFTGGVNGGAAYAAAKAECVRLFEECKAALPRARIIVVDPFWARSLNTAPANFFDDIRSAVREAVAQVGLPLISTMELPLPFGFAPQVTSLAAAAAQNATQIQAVPALSPECTYVFDDGTPVRVKTVAAGSFIAQLDGPLSRAQANGAGLTQIGGSVVTGTGNVGAPTGYGTADRITSADTTHPSQFGHDVHGMLIAHGLLGILHDEARAA